ncbi:MAG TPA: tetratricopeptide repeat protein [Gemmatimonadaceae bacterium]|nr:tetratricopeptide repeat protein [Gemmatimonadaceae bacterium]
MKLSIATLSVLLLAAPVAGAQGRQSAADHVAIGDRDRAALNSVNALKHYEAALAVDSMYYDALIKASREAVELGRYNTNEAERTALYKRAEQYARRAVAAKPNDAESHFELAKAIGKNAQTMGSKDRVKFAGVVHDEAMAALKIAPKHAGALHVMGVWNAEVMRLSGVSRFMAKNVLGGKVFGQASWDNAIRYMEQAVAEDPNRITHRLDLAEIYLDRKMKDKAKEQLEWIASAPITELNDKHYKAAAAEMLAKIK